MKISDLIQQLENFKARHGDIPVAVWRPGSAGASGDMRPVSHVSLMSRSDDSEYLAVHPHLNWPSKKTGKPSGDLRDNA